ncbi:MAG: gliding motility-associated C-terminal domain-containing protein, partial [Saprospiraceae bacterium]|nr:gliding motility-associated C-terminal domain-containing protein [Saprospiraceae bacterium]
DSAQTQVQLSACPGETAAWNGQNLPPGGPYPFALTAANGCDSTVFVTVLPLDSAQTQVQLSACPGETAAWNGQNLPVGGPYPFALTAANGCDSTVLITVLELVAPQTTLQLGACPGETAAWNGQNLPVGGPYPFTLPAANGCDSTVLITVLELVAPQTTLQLGACPGETAAWNGQNLPVGGPYPFTLPAANGCDSTVLITVLELVSPQTTLQLGACPGETAAWNGQNLPVGGPYPFTLPAANGCDSTVLITVLELVAPQTTLQLGACPGETAAWNGQNLPVGGPYSFVLPAANGCDSTILITVMALDSVQTQVELSACAGETVAWNGQNLAPGGPYPFIFEANNGCDSTVLVTVLELDSAQNQVDLSVCPGQTAIWNGQSLPVGGPYPFVFAAANGCDSTVLVRVNMFPGITIDLPAFAVVNLSTSLSLQPVISGTPPLQYLWTPAEGLSCQSCPDPVAYPVFNTWYAIQVTDAAGCVATDSIFVKVRSLCDVYFPNAFQPDDDGHNDWFYPQTASCVRLVRVLRVYGRWGELVFERRDFEPNVEALGWNGLFRQQEMNPGVFTWYAELELTNDQIERVQGDVTLIR